MGFAEGLGGMVSGAGGFKDVFGYALQGLSGIMEYQQQKQADKAEKRIAYAEAAKLQQDASIAALNEQREADRHRSLQKMLFLKSGVSLEGSPLLVMEETRQKGEENARNVRNSASASASVIRQKGSVKRASLVNTGLDVAKGVYDSYTRNQVLKDATQQRQNPITWEKQLK